MAVRPLDPDEFNLNHATFYLLLPCPFCGQKGALPMDYVNDERTPPVYRTIVKCTNDTRCGAEVSYNDYTRDGARTKAIERWQRRPEGGR